MLTRSEAAKQIKAAVEAYERENYEVSIWQKGDKCRLYIKDMGYRNARAQDQGFFSIKADGAFVWDGIKNNSSVIPVIKKAVEEMQIRPDMQYMEIGQRLTPEQAEAIASQPRHDYRSDTAKALDAMYGKGNWDDRDREDYEG